MNWVDGHALLSDIFINFQLYWMKEYSYFFKEMKAVLVVACNQLRVKNDYILPLNKYRHHKTNISPNRRDIANSKIRFHKKKIANGFSIPLDYSPYCPWRIHFGNALVLERVWQRGEIWPRLKYFSLLRQHKCNAFFSRITYLQNKTGKGYQLNIAFFFLSKD